MKAYLKYSLIKKLPLFIIILATFLVIAFTSASNVSFFASHPRDGYYYFSNRNTGAEALIYVFFFAMMFLPFFSMNYRYSLERSDLYRQVAIKDRAIRYIDHLSTLIITVVCFIVAYLFLVGILAYRNYFPAYIPEDNEYVTYEQIFFSYIYFLPLLALVVILGIGEYAISYLLISRSNNFLNSLIILTAGQLVLTFALSTIVMFFDAGHSLVFYGGSSVIFGPYYLLKAFTDLIVFDDYSFQTYLESNRFETFYFIASGIIFIGLAALGIVSFILEKDPSSEYAGKPITLKPYQEIIYHLGFGITGTFICASIMPYANFFFYPMYLVLFSSIYYTLYGLLRRNFKIKGWQIGLMIGVVFSTLIIGLIYRTMYFANEQVVIYYY